MWHPCQVEPGQAPWWLPSANPYSCFYCRKFLQNNRTLWETLLPPHCKFKCNNKRIKSQWTEKLGGKQPREKFLINVNYVGWTENASSAWLGIYFSLDREQMYLATMKHHPRGDMASFAHPSENPSSFTMCINTFPLTLASRYDWKRENNKQHTHANAHTHSHTDP